MLKQQRNAISQTHRVEWRIGQNGYHVCIRACEHSTSRTSTADVEMMVGSLSWSCSLQVHRQANVSSISKMSQPRSGWMNSTISQVHSFQGILYTQESGRNSLGERSRKSVEQKQSAEASQLYPSSR